MNIKKLGVIWRKYFDYDRIAERKIIKSINLWNKKNIIFKIRAMFLYNSIRRKYSCLIHPKVKIGNNFYISHAQDIVIGETSIIGNNCKIYPGAKMIAKVDGDINLVKNNLRRHPKIGDNCLLGADSILIGNITIGNNVIIAAGAICTKNVPDNCMVIGTNDIRERKVDKNECK